MENRIKSRIIQRWSSNVYKGPSENIFLLEDVKLLLNFK